MLEVTANALRQQVVNNEARRLDRIIKEALEDIGDDRDKMSKVLTGRRVLLAEELSKFLVEFLISLRFLKIGSISVLLVH